jgi:hypothetical protein
LTTVVLRAVPVAVRAIATLTLTLYTRTICIAGTVWSAVARSVIPVRLPLPVIRSLAILPGAIVPLPLVPIGLLLTRIRIV